MLAGNEVNGTLFQSRITSNRNFKGNKKILKLKNFLIYIYSNINYIKLNNLFLNNIN